MSNSIALLALVLCKYSCISLHSFKYHVSILLNILIIYKRFW